MSLRTACWPLVFATMIAAGCAATELPPVTSAHPASPEAPAAHIPPPSKTLTVTDPVEPPPEREMGHMQMDAMGGMKDAAKPSGDEDDEHKHQDEGGM